MQIYIAGTYENRVPLQIAKQKILRSGYVVTSSWLDGNHEGCHPYLCAAHDLDEVKNAPIFMLDLYYNPKYTPGKMTEFGVALASGSEIIVVGDETAHTSVFLSMVDAWLPDWDDMKKLTEMLRMLHVENMGSLEKDGYANTV